MAIISEGKAKVPITNNEDIVIRLTNRTAVDVRNKWYRMNNVRTKTSTKSPEGIEAKREADKRAKTAETELKSQLDTDLYQHGTSDPILDYKVPPEHQGKSRLSFKLLSKSERQIHVKVVKQ